MHRDALSRTTNRKNICLSMLLIHSITGLTDCQCDFILNVCSDNQQHEWELEEEQRLCFESEVQEQSNREELLQIFEHCVELQNHAIKDSMQNWEMQVVLAAVNKRHNFTLKDNLLLVDRGQDFTVLVTTRCTTIYYYCCKCPGIGRVTPKDSTKEWSASLGSCTLLALL